MARVKKDTADYFPHDAEASSGDTLTALQGQFGNDGYAFWFKLLEKLTSSEGHFIDCSNSKRWQVLMGKARVDEITSSRIMILLVEMQAIDKELWEGHRIIWSQNLVDNLADVYKNRKRELPQKPIPGQQLPPKLDSASKEEIPTGKKGITTGNKAITTPENTQSKVEYSKVEESRVDNSVVPNYLKKGTAKTLQDAKDAYADNIEELSETMENEIELVVGRFSAVWVIDAIREALVLGNPRWTYIAGILKNWGRDGKP